MCGLISSNEAQLAKAKQLYFFLVETTYVQDVNGIDFIIAFY